MLKRFCISSKNVQSGCRMSIIMGIRINETFSSRISRGSVIFFTSKICKLFAHANKNLQSEQKNSSSITGKFFVFYNRKTK